MPSRQQNASVEISGIPRAAPAHEPSYGLDAPPVVAGFVALGLLGVAFLLLTLLTPARLLGAGLGFCVVGWGTAALMVHSSLRGKRLVRDRVLNGVAWRGNEDVVDLGTGRGLMLLGAALRAPQGSATGIDVWRSVDQAGSSPERLLANAAALGVADRVRVVTGDMSATQLPDASADLVLACLSIHNIHDRATRRAVIEQAARMLRPGGRLTIIDFAKTAQYVADAQATGLVDVRRSGLTARMWPPVRIVTARKPTISPTPTA
jgi:SAM-dependent methyltransferase